MTTYNNSTSGEKNTTPYPAQFEKRCKSIPIVNFYVIIVSLLDTLKCLARFQPSELLQAGSVSRGPPVNCPQVSSKNKCEGIPLKQV